MWTGSVLTGFRLYFYCGQVEFFLSFFNAACLNVLKLCFDKYSWNNAKELNCQYVILGCGVFMSENSQFFLNWMS